MCRAQSLCVLLYINILRAALIDQQSHPTENKIMAFGQNKALFNNPAVAYITRLGSKGSKRTVLSSLRIIAQMLGFSGIDTCPWHELKRPHILQILFNLSEKGLSPATQNSYLSSLKGVCEEAWMLELMSAEDYQKIYKIPSVKGSRLASGRALESKEVASLMRSCSHEHCIVSARDKAILALLIGCGLRKAEVISLKLEDIDWKDSSFNVIGKGNKQAKCFMPQQTRTALKAWLNLRGQHSGYLFSRILKNGALLSTPITGQGITYILKKRGTMAQIDSFAPHDIRRTFATRMFESGADALIVQAAMRHANLDTTRRYDFRGEKKLKEVSQSISFFD